MSELENDYEVEQENDEIVEEVEAEEVEESSESETAELAPDSEAEHEEQPQDEHKVNQEKVNQVINRKHREAMEWKEKYEAVMRSVPQQQQEAAPEILPEPDDPFDDDFESKLKAHVESVKRRALWEEDQKRQQEQQQYTQQQAQKAQLEQLQTQAASYTERAKSYGISNEELQVAANTVAQAGISDELAIAILGDEDGPLFTKYLASNPIEAYEIAQMNTVQAALHLERVVRPKATALKPKKTNAPKPATKVKSASHDPDLSQGILKGARFE